MTAALASAAAFIAAALGVLYPRTNAHAAGSLACDLYAAGGTPRIGAHSTTRALGPPRAVRRRSGLAVCLDRTGGSHRASLYKEEACT
jgi:hypothetical protein